MKMSKLIILFSLFLLLVSEPSFSQKKSYEENDYKNMEVEMADKLRADGKIYVVVAVLTTILVGLFVYAIVIDRKISSLEKEFNQKTQK